ncbi:MAG TPA: glycoside hydrolase family 28 protein, partial [Terriglobales bacterium]|nr:glycoside hydrolase family 28 protein [Terriglobales bacterium]
PWSARAETGSVNASSLSYDVTAFGAKGDGKTLDTGAINKAIDAAAAAGGGVVHFPAGKYLSYSIRLKSNITLHLSPGATILATDPPSDSGGGYDLAESNAPWEAYQDFGHNHWHNSLIWGEGLENVSIVGPGLIWGKGLSRGWGTGPKAETPGAGNKAIALKNCRNVLLRDFSILHGGHFGILATGVDNLTIDNLVIDTNRDGMDIDCCRNVRISNCTVNSPWDDGICLKSSFALGYAKATEMVTITNCLVTGDYEEGTVIDATFKHFAADSKTPRTGRIKFGTESNGGFKNITISNCVFDGCSGLALETVDGALLEDVSITNITMRDLFGPPIFLRLGARMRGPANVVVGALRRVLISNVVCSNAKSAICSSITGIPGHEIEDLKISNIVIRHRGGGSKGDAALQLPEKEKDYPEPNMFGMTPAHGFFIRHVRGLEMSDIKIVCEKEDARPAFVLEDVVNADFFRVKLPETTNPSFALKNVEHFSVSKSMPVPDTELKKSDRTEF